MASGTKVACNKKKYLEKWNASKEHIIKRNKKSTKH